MPIEPYFSCPNPFPEKSIEQIWDDIDSFTYENMFKSPAKAGSINFYVCIPPLNYDGIRTKGFVFTQAPDVLLEKFPDLNKIFVVAACSMWSSYPHSEKVDAYVVCYDNKAHEEYQKTKYPNKKNIICLPLQEADWINEYAMTPVFEAPKTIDVMIVASAFNFKNPPFLAHTLKLYEQKYGRRLKVVWALGNANIIKNPDGSLDYSKAQKNAIEELDALHNILGDAKQYIEFYPRIKNPDLPKFYSMSKCSLLCSLLEGKNRFIQESMYCNTPVVVFREHNQYTRGNTPIFYGNSGEFVPEFTHESLADTIHKVITNYQNYEPRKNLLMHSGRKYMVDKITELIPYFRENIPNYNDKPFHDNLFVDLACISNYGLSYHDFMYDKKMNLSSPKGIDAIRETLKLYYSKFSIPFVEK